jgi:hypothetical protein
VQSLPRSRATTAARMTKTIKMMLRMPDGA